MRRLIGSGVIVGLGFCALILHVLHYRQEQALHSAILGALLPMALALLLISVGRWVFTSQFSDRIVLRMAGWTGIGAAGGLLFGYPVIPYQAAHGVPLVDVPFLLVNYLTVGALAGSVIGYYDGHQQRYQTQLEDIRDELRTREQELEEENERLDAFASLVSHDLRNPLNVVAGRMQLAKETGDTSHLADALDAVDRMETIIEDLLLVAQEGDAVSDDALEAVQLRDVAKESWKTCETGSATLEVEDSYGFEADRSRLKHVFENLYRNAVEHGYDEVTVRVGSLDGSGFYVEDTGPGIPPDKRDQVFEFGYSTNSSGTGFGLYLVKQIAVAHGWQVTVTQSDEGGTRFEFDTPSEQNG
ncbi:HAMP domain-containing sensor histidine kinase [Salarchaeum sp. JOR-1]|uniref:sensor histidine kinase n=1 Tax=Salarchaeum sp. JOR-1 TaxID=2599399 RepID=UPI00143D779A|nr:HAMP domain-containing sensor histidine kinase [Salarchaeum sp. JOR-1]